ncbi:MAG: divergent polysaccharide deacetylase family protein [Acetobacteraceae bacterium]|nr:divergent polysaccharide deacetylase family protein [Acetobacteraceae bacterium]
MRGLARFWIGVLAAAVCGVIIVQALGPPARPPTRPEPIKQPEQPVQAEPSAPATVPARIALPHPALLEGPAGLPSAALPKIAADGRTPMQVYSAPFSPADRRSRIGIVLAGIGLSEADSEDAIRKLPGGITLAFSPYSARPEDLLEAARAAGHEFLISLPLEPEGYPVNDAGDHALLTGATPAQNRDRLNWALSRIQGYVGATGALGTLHGERFAASAEQMNPVLDTLARRGLLYIGTRNAAPPVGNVAERSVDVIIDDPADGRDIDLKLAQLEQIARERGSALGLAGAVRPVTIAHLAAWASGLADRGFTLAPVSALVSMPRTQAKSEQSAQTLSLGEHGNEAPR